MYARDIAKRIDAELPKYFITLPRKPYGVVPVPAAIAPNYTWWKVFWVLEAKLQQVFIG